jgi:hypothetical protein
MAKNDKWRIKEAVKIAEEAALKALRTGAEGILTEAIDEAPVDTGTLRRSGTVTVGSLPKNPGQIYQDARPVEEGGQEKEHKDAFPEPIGKEKAVYISFNTPYARRQHEELGYNHPLGGKAKYLEDPFNRNKNKVLKYAAKQVKKALEKAK